MSDACNYWQQILQCVDVQRITLQKWVKTSDVVCVNVNVLFTIVLNSGVFPFLSVVNKERQTDLHVTVLWRIAIAMEMWTSCSLFMKYYSDVLES